MLISPPFLPPREADQSDADWLNVAMNSVSSNFIPELGNDTIAGAYPVSMELGWHGGMHLIAPPGEGGTTLPVRTIADGTIIFVRQPKVKNRNDDEPLNYGAPAGSSCWTSDGVVLIRHETDIGASPDGQAISVVFYSLYMHMDSIADGVARNRRIYRKEELGSAGYIYGQPHRIHFEIFCDDENLQRLTGRQSGELPLEVDGRNSVVFGEMHFHLPVGSHVYPKQPLANQTTPTDAPAHTTEEDLFVGLHYAEGDGPVGQRGDATVTTYHRDGIPEGEPLIERDAEYNLYAKAKAIAEAYSPTGRPAPSAVYELLRFGRVINTANETLSPPDVPHWRKIRYPGGEGWANLNATNIRKFSDADFPHWKGWCFIDDSADRDSRCDSPTIRRWFNTNQDAWVDIAEAREGLSNRDLLHKLEHTICKFPSEWRANTIDQRWAWLMNPEDENFEALSDDDFKDFKAHARALCFWEQVPAQTPALPDDPWRFHARRFIEVFRRCGWLSLNEVAQLMPRRHGLTQASQTSVSWGTATRRFQSHQENLNRTLRKYLVLSPSRQVHFLAQTYIETAMWQTMEEYGRGHQQTRKDGSVYWPAPAMQYYTVFHGRGIMQLTWAGNYDDYGTYRQLACISHLQTYHDPRITHTSTHHWQDPRDRYGHVVRQPRTWHPRYDPHDIANDAFSACDSGGFYWVSKNTGNNLLDINRVADRGYTTAAVARISVLVNGGGYGFAERQGYAAYINRYRSDSTDNDSTSTITATYGGRERTAFVDFLPQRP